MDYNTQRPRLVLPEYGRLVQDMVNYALTLEDRDKRQACAEAIISVMENFFPQQHNQPDFKHKLWDHLAIMSDYRLDIDYPYEITRKPSGHRPERLPYPTTKIKFRHYGLLIEELTRKLNEMPEGEERTQLARLVASQMKRSLAEWNKDSLNDRKIINDLAQYTNGKIELTPDDPVFNRPFSQMSRPVNRNGKRYKRNY